MKFAHIADCHLGAWRQPELSWLNFKSFKDAISISIEKKVDFILIAGDLFDSAYPPIDTLKDTFREFRRIKESKIPVFLIAGSHDYSASGKSFLDVLEKAGFCKNVSKFEEKDGKIILLPTTHENVAIYGYPGKKSGLEIDEVEKIKLNDCPGLFKIIMLHTTLRSAVQNPKVKAVDDTKLPEADYFAMGHLHISKVNKNKVYPGPTFPNNLPELEDLKGGAFYIFDNGKIEKQEIKINQILIIDYETSNSLNATDEILKLLEKEILKDKILIVKVSGVLSAGKTSDINFTKLESYSKNKGVLLFLKTTSRLYLAEQEIKLDIVNTEDLETQIINQFEDSRPSKFNGLVPQLAKTLQMEKLDDEKSSIFEERLLSETNKIIGI